MTFTLRGRDDGIGRGDIIRSWKSLKLIERCNTPDTLQVEGRTSELRSLFTTAGSLDLSGGCTLNDSSGRRFSGPLSQVERNGDGTCTLTFESDLIRLWERILWPKPSAAWTAQADAYDVRSGAAETVIKGYVGANLGPTALAARIEPGFVIETSAGAGGSMSYKARFEPLGPTMAGFAESHALRMTVVQDGTDLVFKITPLEDLSATAKFGLPNQGGPGRLSGDWSYTLDKPDVTTALVAGGGEGTARVLRPVTDGATEMDWNRRVEGFVDQRQTSVLSELDAAGAEALSVSPVKINATILDSPSLPLSTIPLGSLVTLNLDGELIQDRLRQLTTTVARKGNAATVTVQGVVGTLDATLTRSQRDFLAVQKNLRKAGSQ